MNRWSVIKRFGRRVTFDDFTQFAKQFYDIVDALYKSPSVVTITLYGELPHSISTLVPEFSEGVVKENRKKQTAKVSDLEEVTREMFDAAVNVQLSIHPTGDDGTPANTFGHLECKGLLNDRFVYYVQPEKVGEPVKRSYLADNKPSAWKFKIGDGWEHCH